MSKIFKVVIGVVVLLIALILLAFSYYIYELTPISNDETMIKIEIPKGATASSVGKILKANSLIRDTSIFKLYLKLHNVNKMNYGTYELNKTMDVEKLVDIISGGKSVSSDIKLLFKEGINMRGLAKVISTGTNNSEEDVFNLLKDTTYIDSLIDEYWFLTDEIKNSDIYYPLEGYLAPNTYQFASKDVTVKEIFKTMLDQMNTILTPYKDNLKKYTIGEYLTLASIVEQEGRTLEDRQMMADLFYRRLASYDSLGSDVTTYYAIKVDNYSRSLYSSEINTYNPYNTRGPKMGGKLPIGPICSPGEISIRAVAEPIKNDYYYFVADITGKIYFTKTNAEHSAKIEELKKAGKWLE